MRRRSTNCCRGWRISEAMPFSTRSKRPQFAGKLHLTDHLAEEVTQQGRRESVLQTRDKRRIAWHRLRDYNIRLPDCRTRFAANTYTLELTLRSHPESECRDLGAARINVNPVKVVRQDIPGHACTQQPRLRVVFAQCAACRLGSGRRLVVPWPLRRSSPADRTRRAGSGRIRRLGRAHVYPADPSSARKGT